MSWILISIIAYLLLAATSVIDKFLVTRTQLKPVAYAFYVGVFNGLAIFLAPFGLSFPGLFQVFAALLAGAASFLALLLFFKTLQKGEASRISPLIGGVTPIFTLLLSYFFLGSHLGAVKITAFLFLVAGGLLMSLKATKDHFRVWFLSAILTSFVFAVSWIMIKFIYINQPFFSGFLWMRFGTFFAALFLLISPSAKKAAFETAKTAKIKTRKIFLLNRILGPSYFILINYAIFLSSVALVNALQGAQYVFLFIFTIFISFKLPNILKEEENKKTIFLKSLAIGLVGAGLYLLVKT